MADSWNTSEAETPGAGSPAKGVTPGAASPAGAEAPKADLPPIAQPLASALAGRPAGGIGAILEALLTALLSPLVLVCPRWLARRCLAHPVQVLLWQLGLIVVMLAAPELATTVDVIRLGIEEVLLLLLALGIPVVMLGLGCMLIAVAGWPLASTWYESTAKTYWKTFSLVVYLVLPVLVVAGVGGILIDNLMRELLFAASPTMSDQEHTMAWQKGMFWEEAFYLALVLLALVQVLRGLVWEGGPVPVLEPLCRDCGYSLEGVREAYSARKSGAVDAGAAPLVCSECGCRVELSMEPSARPGTPWTRGEALSLRSWWRTVRQVQWRPGEFLAALPLEASRDAALRFWMMNLGASFAALVGILLIDYLVCQGTRVVGPIWPGYDVRPAYQWMNGSPYWFLAALHSTGSYLIAVWLPAAALGGLVGARLGWRMSRVRRRNMQPAGFLLTAYLSGHMLGAFLLMLAVPMAGRIAVRTIGPYRVWVESNMALGMIGAGGVGLVAGLAWYMRAARAARRGLQYANGSSQLPVASCQ